MKCRLISDHPVTTLYVLSVLLAAWSAWLLEGIIR